MLEFSRAQFKNNLRHFSSITTPLILSAMHLGSKTNSICHVNKKVLQCVGFPIKWTRGHCSIIYTLLMCYFIVKEVLQLRLHFIITHLRFKHMYLHKTSTVLHHFHKLDAICKTPVIKFITTSLSGSTNLLIVLKLCRNYETCDFSPCLRSVSAKPPAVHASRALI